MLIIKQEGLAQEFHSFNTYKDRHIQINIKSEYVIFNYKNKRINYELSKGLVLLEDHIDKRLLIVSIKNKYEPINFIFTIFEVNLNRYTKYQIKDYISIGNCIDNDIYLSDSLLSEEHLIINTLNNSFKCNGYIKPYINNEISNNKYNVLDILGLINLKIIIHKDFIMVNDCKNIHVNIKKFNTITNEDLEKYNNKYIKKTFRIFNDFKFNEYFINQPEPIYAVNQNPLIFSIGPALTMSLASLLSGSIAIYNSYMQGREIIETLPMLILPLVMLISTLFWNPIQRRFEKKKKINYEKQRIKVFKSNLNDIHNSIKNEEIKYKRFINDNYLNPNNLDSCINTSRNLLFQKSINHDDFLKIYIGNGNISSKFKFSNRYNLDIKLNKIYEEFINETSFIKDTGIIIDLLNIKNISIVKNYYDEDVYAKYLLLQLLTYYSYEDINLVLLCNDKWLIQNKEYLYLNHIKNNYGRYVGTNQNEVININKIIDSKPTIVYIENNDLYKYLKIDNKYIINSCDNINDIPSYCNSYILVDSYKGTYVNNESHVQQFKINSLCNLNIKNLVYELSKYKINYSIYNVRNNTITLFNVLGIRNIKELDIPYNYSRNIDLKNIDVVLGKSDLNSNVVLDISENGMGPHGLIAGMTGSGKSELIITLITLLCTKYSPKYLQVSIIDYKGGGIIQSFKNNNYTLPHLVGTLSNLDVNELRRCLVSYNIEILKRQKLFNRLSNKYNISNMNIDIYQRYSNKDEEFENLAHLIIVVDEFAELKKQEYEFMSELISIARIGRSLGIHLILSTQKPSGVVDDQIWSNCRFKICLKVQNKQDSFEMLHINDASNLKDSGSFYLLYDDILEKGKSAWSNSYSEIESINQIQILDNTLNVKYESIIQKSNKTQLLDVMKKICSSNIFEANQLWLPSIDKVTFDSFSNKEFYLGLIDDYYNRRYVPLIYNGNHMAVISTNTIEKKRFVNVLLYSILRKIDKQKTEVYVLDGLNCNLNIFYDFPAIIDILKIYDDEKIINLFKKCEKIINDNVVKKDIYIIITNVSQFKEQYELLLDKYKLILSYGYDYKINLILFISINNSLHYQEHNLIKQKLCLINENQSEVMSFLDTNKKITHNKEGYGLLKLNNILEFKYSELTIDEINKLKKDTIISQGKNKLYQLPFVPKNLTRKYYKGDKLPIGIIVNNYQWLESNENIVICGLYSDIIEEYSKLFNLNVIKNDQINKNINLNKSILWVGPGYTRQYILPINFKEDLNENEGIYYHRNKTYRIRLIDE